MERAYMQYVKEYVNEVEQSIYEPTVNRHFSATIVDEKKAFFLLLPLLNGEAWSAHLQTSAVAVGAVHAAFDVHDRIDVIDATPKSQQLLVLSGDHFSGIYYRLLASLPDFPFIRSLSGTIGLINETKTNMMKKPPVGSEQVIKMIAIIEAGCIADFYQRFGFTAYLEITELVLPLLWIGERLGGTIGVQERVIGQNINMTDLELAYSKLAQRLEQVLENAYFLSSNLKNEITEMIIPFAEHADSNRR
ncbi:heptaprenyl diphosphate synthase component 1 [Sporosarcina sp. Te-1]|uniref:heptaprenyl diphosphate synthase component 1 n=1 Tax=Sporosarcina sp. Te-1 TaxID=2818390 RepID=UPI001A9F4A7C|nr:heptaprenyl diphosphate synthase component 1 [Sporosarcina sp. Te-1]QTD42184.1 heptaprenyl diphosphate synthase component 1 [Sporosarcina sp. Te-1]